MGRGEGGEIYSNDRDIILHKYLVYSRGGRRGCWTGEDVCAAESVTSKEWSLHESLLVIIGIILPRC